MFHLHKGLLLGLAPIAAVAAFAVTPALAQAQEWTVNGSPVTTTTDVTTFGQTTLTVSAGPNAGLQIVCGLSDSGTISPNGVDALDSATFSNCSSNVGAPVTVDAENTPWPTQLNGSPVRDMVTPDVLVTLGDPFDATEEFTGPLNPLCVNDQAPLAGAPFSNDTAQLQFNSSDSADGTLTGSLGDTGVVDGVDSIWTTSGDEVDCDA